MSISNSGFAAERRRDVDRLNARLAWTVLLCSWAADVAVLCRCAVIIRQLQYHMLSITFSLRDRQPVLAY